METNKTVTVGNRLPTGLLLQLRDPENQQVVLAEVEVEGCATKVEPYIKPFRAGFTEVNAELWEKWEKWAKSVQFKPLLSGAIFACKDLASAQAKAREMELERTLLEGLDVSAGTKDPRMAAFRKEIQKHKED